LNAPAFFEIQADNVQRAIAFYRAAFSWKFTRQPGLPVEYWLIETERDLGGILQRPASPPPAQSGTNAYVCSMEVANFDRTAEIIMKNGGQVALEKFAVPGRCWQGYFIDTEGNTFGIFQVDEKAA
jgi:predicted enzyme related to lactoylglutathione lyase